MKSLFLVFVTIENVLQLDLKLAARGNDSWANFLCKANEVLWPNYDGEGWRDLWLGS